MSFPDAPIFTLAGALLQMVFRNEHKLPEWLMQALKTSNHPVVFDGIIITTNPADLYGEFDEYETPETFDRSAYTSILKRDSKHRSISATDKMVTSFIDMNRNFRLDMEYNVVLFEDRGEFRSIDAIEIDLHDCELNDDSDEILVDWFQRRIHDVSSWIEPRKSPVSHLMVIVDNSRRA